MNSVKLSSRIHKYSDENRQLARVKQECGYSNKGSNIGVIMTAQLDCRMASTADVMMKIQP